MFEDSSIHQQGFNCPILEHTDYRNQFARHSNPFEIQKHIQKNFYNLQPYS